MSQIQYVNSDQFQNEVLDFSGTVLVDFTAAWCGPCQQLTPILDNLSLDMKDNTTVKIVKIDVDANEELSKQYKVSSIPNVTFIKNGQEISRLIGLRGINEYKKAIFEASLK